MKTSTRIPIPLALLENRRAGSEILQKPLCAAGMLDGIWEEGRSRQEAKQKHEILAHEKDI